jgi:hypothetical protein
MILVLFRLIFNPFLWVSFRNLLECFVAYYLLKNEVYDIIGSIFIKFNYITNEKKILDLIGKHY